MLRCARDFQGLRFGWRSSALLLAILLFIPVPTARALDPGRSLTQYLHRIWQVQQGLPQSTIYAIRQTSDGYLWLGTQSGLCRFDGVRFTTLDTPEAAPLKEAWIRDLLETPDQSLWVATHDAGLFQIKGGIIRHFGRDNGLPSDRVYRVIAARDGQVWACTSDGLAMVAPRTGQVLQRQQGLATNDIRAAGAAADGTLWVAGEGARLDVWDGATARAQQLTSVPAATDIHDILATADGTMWIATDAGLVALRGDTERLYTSADGLADNAVYRLLQGAGGALWAGTQDGFSRLRPGGAADLPPARRFDSFQARDGLSQSTVFALCEDREGSLWVGTKHGLNQFLDGRIIPFTTSEGLPSNNTGPILQDARGDIWIGSLDAGLSHIDSHGLVTLTTRDGLPSNTIIALAADSDGLWIGTDHGLTRLSPPPSPTSPLPATAPGRPVLASRTLHIADGLPSDGIRSLFVAPSGALWVGTTAGAAVLARGRWTTPTLAEGIATSPVVAFASVGDAILAARENAGLLIFRDGIGHDFSPPGDSIRDAAAYCRDPDGLLWIGMRSGGLGLYDGNRVVDFTVQDGLFDDDLRAIVPDHDARLWLACSKGLFSVNRSDLDRIAAGTVKTLVSMPFSPTEGLRTIECSAGVAPAACMMRDGRIWFSTIRGLVIIDPAHLERNQPPPRVVVEQVLVDGKTRENAQTLPPGVKNVEFRYTGLSFITPSRISFRYQLEGFDKGWVDAAVRREAFYTNLPPGPYRFRVMAANADGIWSDASAPVMLVLAPQFYQHLWFIPFCVLLAAVVATAGFRLRIRTVRRRMDAILAERGRIARELHDTLVQGFSGVTMQMQALLARTRGIEPAVLGRDLQDIIHDATMCLREARRSIAGLREPAAPRSGLADLIADTVRQQTEHKPLSVHLRLDACPHALPAQVEYNLLRIVQEATANTLRHAQARSLQVTAATTPQSLVVEVRDDGRGFSPPPADVAGNRHFGLVGMRERASAIGAELQIDSQPQRGTVIRITIPLRRAAQVDTGAAPAKVQNA